MTRIKMHISNVKLPFYPPCEIKYGLQNKVLTGLFSLVLWRTTRTYREFLWRSSRLIKRSFHHRLWRLPYTEVLVCHKQRVEVSYLNLSIERSWVPFRCWVSLFLTGFTSFGSQSVSIEVRIREEPNQVGDEQIEVVKRGKSNVDFNSKESAGVPMHPCRSQWNSSGGIAKGLKTLRQFETFTN